MRYFIAPDKCMVEGGMSYCGVRMKVVILAGGYGSRLAEETALLPKPMIEIGGEPILWHIMMIYSHFGFTDFIICLGYKGFVIKDYFRNFAQRYCNAIMDLRQGSIEYINSNSLPPWRVTLMDTGADTMTGGRLKRISPLLNAGDSFCMTYGDGVANVDINALVAFHHKQGRDATLTAVRPAGRFGVTHIEGDLVKHFREKPSGEGGYVNGGFFVLKPCVLDRIKGDEISWELEPLEGLASDGQLAAFIHNDFWQPMDTLRDKQQLEQLWKSGRAPWKIWQ